MNRTVIEAILRTWNHQRDYAMRLVEDVPDGELVSQPVPGVVMNHPAWVLSHLAAYPPVLTALLRGEAFEDPASHRYGRESRPLDDRGEYLPKAELMGLYREVHDELAGAMRGADPAVLEAPTALERWRARFPVLFDAACHLMTSHEATHLGQLSAWRRAGGRPPV